MKKTISIALLLISSVTFAMELEVDVISSEYGMTDHLQNKSLCLTTVRVPSTGELLGLVEGIGDCFYAREAKKHSQLFIDFKYFRKISMPELQEHLQSIEPQLKFLFSEG